ncbi:MAG: CoB--CoM heterodisulfide reductase iron-sulfur subunit A family protein [Acidobacteria bacterium]|nr:CoB--CoM heterodisulfide reductase iron-sulfur subunit A family protein [Acidobacteriota bacterium]
MPAESKVGIYLCQVGIGVPDAVDLQALADYAANLPNVAQVKILGVRPRVDPRAITREIQRVGLDAVVIAGDTPGYFKPAFARAMGEAGREPGRVRLASFREHGAAFARSTERAKAIVACAVHGVPFGLAAIPEITPVHPDTVVIGGGVAGIQAALEIADAGKKVYLVERSGTIGGHMAMFDKTFPTLDCAACILTPKMVAVGQHPNIDLLTYAEVEHVAGSPGAFRVQVRKKARRVDAAACVACHACMEVCPASAPSEFDCGIARRKAIYMPFPQAVPNSYLIDAEACIWVQTEGKRCGACVKKCAKEAIHLDASDEIVEIEAGNIVVATGYDIFDARRIERYGYGKFPNVLTALEFERLTNASGPTGGQVVLKTLQHDKRRKVDEWVHEAGGPAPRSVAIIHCVGSRDANYNSYCSRVCCMYSLKFAHLVREKLPDAACYEFYIDMRAFGKGYEEFFERIKDEGVYVVRGRSAKVVEQNGQLCLKGEDIVSEKVLDLPVDMVVLAVGLEPAAGAGRLADILGIQRDDDGWFSELDYNADPTATERGGIFVAGVCQGPRDIPDTVAQASAVAARAIKGAVSGRGAGSRSSLSLRQIEERAAELARG